MILYVTREKKKRKRNKIYSFEIKFKKFSNTREFDFQLNVTEKIIYTEISKENKIVYETKNWNILNRIDKLACI